MSAEVSHVVGQNLREARRKQGYSLDALAQVSGVSRAMLGQIETGKSVPTITIIWKVAQALGVPVAQIISRPGQADYVVQTRSQAKVLTDDAGQFSVRAIEREPGAHGVQFQEVRIAPGHEERVASQSCSIRLIVVQGSIGLALGDEAPVRLGQGDAIFFSGVHEHVVSNPGDDESILYLIAEPNHASRR